MKGIQKILQADCEKY